MCHQGTGSYARVIWQRGDWPANEYGNKKEAWDFATSLSSFAGFRCKPGTNEQVGFRNKLADLGTVMENSTEIKNWMDVNFNLYVWNKKGLDYIIECKVCKVQFHLHVSDGDRKDRVHEWKDDIGKAMVVHLKMESWFDFDV